MLSVPLHAGCFVLGERYRKCRSGSKLLLPVCATGRSCLFGGEAVEIFTGGKFSGLLQRGYSTFIDLGHKSPV